ncbi:MAG: exo-alpha-sialidase, partial [Clostridia bacterium]|nr:exo-alpha-sialidase [Clostridia bacterium]
AEGFDGTYAEGTVLDAPECTVVKMTIGNNIGYVNGTSYTLDAAPIIRGSRTMLPVRFVAEAFGAKVGWDGATSTATLTSSDAEIKITIGANTAFVNGKEVALDAPAFIEKSRTYMPVRFVAENLGATVAWDGATSTATLTKEGIFSSLPEDTAVADGIKLNTISDLNGEKVTSDSHEGLTASSSVELNFREYTEIPAALLSTSSAMYPRIKKMQNGEYILFYQNGQIGSNIYYTTSADTIKWAKASELFKLHAATNGLGEQDSIRYTTCDAVVLANGDVLAVASFRYNQGYAKAASEGGLVTRRSSDNGKTWIDEKVIYVGINWEPYITQTKSGEVQIFFTHNAPKFYLDGKLDKDYLSSGVGKLVSNDNGETWTPNVTSAPYSASIVMQQLRKVNSAKTLYTDQMPSVVYLNNGTSVMAVESRPDNGELYISLGYSSDLWNIHLSTEEVGPAKRADNIFEGAAPYITQFDSGETLLSYNVNNRFSVRIGDTNGENFGESIVPFTKTGYWGTLEKRTSHSAIGSIANSVSEGTNSIMVGTLYLNHAIGAPSMNVT